MIPFPLDDLVLYISEVKLFYLKRHLQFIIDKLSAWCDARCFMSSARKAMAGREETYCSTVPLATIKVFRNDHEWTLNNS